MLSIICSTQLPSNGFKKHVLDTCGVKDAEFIFYENKNQYSLTELYNKGLKEAKYDYIVFIHHDILFNESKWGKSIKETFDNTEYAILGVAGSTEMPASGRWWDAQLSMVGAVKHSNDGKTWESKYSSNYDFVIDVVLVDGVFMAVNRKRIKSNFDETVEGFHMYDINFCVDNFLAGCKIGVTFDVKLTHRSIGKTNDAWEANRIKFVAKYGDKLPLKLNPTIHFSEEAVALNEYPELSIIIPTKGNVPMLINCVSSLLKTKYNNFYIKIADTGSSFEEKKEILNFISNHPNVDLVEYDYYNFAEINNDMVFNHVNDATEVILFCNNDILMLNDAIAHMMKVYLKNRKSIGTVGARLYYDDNTIQHAGMLMWLDAKKVVQITHKSLKHSYRYSKKNENVVGNTGAFMLINKELFIKIGGFNVGYKECFEDVELNIKCLLENKKNIFVPDAVCYHYESQTRKHPDKLKRLQEDYKTLLFPLFNNSLKDWRVRQHLTF